MTTSASETCLGLFSVMVSGEVDGVRFLLTELVTVGVAGGSADLDRLSGRGPGLSCLIGVEELLKVAAEAPISGGEFERSVDS